jgi:hypothetical protein
VREEPLRARCDLLCLAVRRIVALSHPTFLPLTMAKTLPISPADMPRSWLARSGIKVNWDPDRVIQ